jgi:hypothetical protein
MGSLLEGSGERAATPQLVIITTVRSRESRDAPLVMLVGCEPTDIPAVIGVRAGWVRPCSGASVRACGWAPAEVATRRAALPPLTRRDEGRADRRGAAAARREDDRAEIDSLTCE